MKWILPENQKDTLLDQLKHIRNIKDEDLFFTPKKEHLYQASLLYGTQEASIAIRNAINNKKKIVIHGDFDVDGITATTILWRFLYYDLKADAVPYIPSRFKEGYGLTHESIKGCLELGADLIITVDCGIKDIELINEYKDKVDFIVTDHHTVPNKSEKKAFSENTFEQVSEHLISKYAKAVVHPALGSEKQPPYPIRDICGAVVSWKLCKQIAKDIDKDGIADKYIDLAALGTVCDIMPLTDENRTIVTLGLEQMRSTENHGLKALATVAGLDISTVKAENLGFILGPRINAVGRLEHALDGVRLLGTTKAAQAEIYSKKLDSLNSKRKLLTTKYVHEALDALHKQKRNRLYNFIVGKNWPEGILGLIAGKLLSVTGLPSLVASENSSGVVKGSARSISGFNVTAALSSASESLLRYGGHAEAAGFSLSADKVETFTDSLDSYTEKNLSKEDLIQKINIDYLMDSKDITVEVLESLDMFEPFGHKNTPPLVGIINTKILNAKYVGKGNKHLKIIAQKGKRNFDAIWFGIPEDKADSLLASIGKEYSFVGSAQINEWRGTKKVTLYVTDGR